MEKLKPYLTFIAIIISALIVGGSYVIVQTNYQKNEKAIADQKIWEQIKTEAARKAEEERSQLLYDNCVDIAETGYWRFVELNGTKNKNGSITADNDIWDRAKRDRQTAIDNCYQQYKK